MTAPWACWPTLPVLPVQIKERALPKLGMEPFRRAQIRQAAFKLIARNGFYGTTLRDVAAAAEVSKGTIHHYYDSKLAMLKDTLIFVSEANLSRMREAVAVAPKGEAKLRALVRTAIRTDTEDAKDAQAVWIWALAEALRSDDVRAVVQERRAVFQEMILRILEQLDGADRSSRNRLRVLAAQIDALLNGIETHKITGERRLEPANAEDLLIETVRTRLAMAAAIRQTA